MGFLGMLVAYDASGNIVATLDYLVKRDASGNALGLVDFIAHEESGAPLSAIWTVPHAVGSGTWPEWLGTAVYDFRVELVGPPTVPRIRALVHKASGLRRERADVESRIARRIEQADGEPVNITDITGGPDRPLRLYRTGRTDPRGLTVLDVPVLGAEG